MISTYCEITGITYSWTNGDPCDLINYTESDGRLYGNHGCVYDWFMDTTRVSDFRPGDCPAVPFIVEAIAYAFD